MSKAGSDKFRDKILAIWMIVYDGDATRIYATNDIKKAMACVEGSIRGYIGDADEASYKRIMRRIRKYKHQPCLPIRVGSLNIVVYHWELDRMHPIHQVLLECYDAVDPGLKT